MSLATAKSGKLLYHLTKFNNLDSILNEGLLPRSILLEDKVEFEDVADDEIIKKRTRMGLDEYVPFHFHPHSAFDHAVKNSYDEEFIYICLHRDYAKRNNFKVLPLHPLTTTDTCEIYDYDEGFNLIDWETMAKTGNNDVYVKNVKMAECLSEEIIDANDFYCIYVGDEDLKESVLELLEEYGLEDTIYINVAPWAKK